MSLMGVRWMGHISDLAAGSNMWRARSPDLVAAPVLGTGDSRGEGRRFRETFVGERQQPGERVSRNPEESGPDDPYHGGSPTRTPLRLSPRLSSSPATASARRPWTLTRP